MRDEDNGNALRLERAHYVKQALHFIVVQRGGRLIQNEHLGVHVHGAGDGDHLLDSGGILGQGPGDVNMHVEALKQFSRAPVHFFPIDLTALHGLTAR